MKVRFDKDYLPMLAAFMAVNDVRFYLCGFHVKAHPEQGVILSATDGHRLVTIHDKSGATDGEYILPISKQLLAASKRKSALPQTSVQFIANKAVVTAWDNSSDGFFDDGDEAHVFGSTYVEYVKPIDGRFPNTKRIFAGFKLTEASNACVNVNYIGSLKSVCTNPKFPIMKLMFSGTEGQMVAVSGYDREIVSVIMPARMDDIELTIPDFVNFGGGTPTESSKD